ncbi:MAG: NAD(P)H-hydrate epimerase, partial [Candidatus Aminicenantes bacterium]|nr:NAD(P)H-hydrate epimerase [Candidatus Aminicenantes bacterium]
MKVANVEEMRVLDKSAIEKFSISDELLMENAGLATCFVIQKELGIWGKRFWVFCGTGNNGGDGFVVARKIHSMGGKVEVFLLGEEKGFKGAAKTNFEIVKKLTVPIKKLESITPLKKQIFSCDAIVDGIFGTGLMRNVEGLYKDVIQFINKSNKKVFSIDIPSGINGNTGQPMGIAVEAFCTVTFGLPKVGNMLYPGYACCGRLYVSHISFPPSLYEKDSLKVEINVPSMLPDRQEDGHKGDFGDVLFIAGAANYFGAPYFAAESFLKAGGGYSRMGAPASLCPVIAQKGSEIVFAPQEETSAGSIALKNKGKLLELCKEVDMVVIGPGLSLNEETQELVRQLTPIVKKPLLIDGDGITAVAKHMDVLKKRKSPTIITPHLGEMARITQKSIS